jgi:hypothetical protein
VQLGNVAAPDEEAAIKKGHRGIQRRTGAVETATRAARKLMALTPP